MTTPTVRFIVIEDSEHGLSASAADLFDDEAEARQTVEDCNRDARQHCIPVEFRLFKLTEVTW